MHRAVESSVAKALGERHEERLQRERAQAAAELREVSTRHEEERAAWEARSESLEASVAKAAGERHEEAILFGSHTLPSNDIKQV